MSEKVTSKIDDEILAQRSDDRTECKCPDCGATLNIVTNEKQPRRTRLEFVKHN